MIMPNDETVKKITGDIADEVPEAGLRLAATLLVKNVEKGAVEYLPTDKATQDAIKTLLNIPRPIREFVIGFALAAVLELVPMPILGDERIRLAYNLRVRSYEELGELMLGRLSLVPLRQFVAAEVERTMRLVKGEELEPVVQPSSDAD